MKRQKQRAKSDQERVNDKDGKINPKDKIFAAWLHQELALLHLAVSDVGVAESVGGEHSPESRDADFILEGRVFRQGAMQVPLDLLSS